MEIIERIMTTLSDELANIITSRYEYYQGYDIVLNNEQQFYTIKENIPGRIYIVVKFGEASLDYGQTVSPITIQAISEHNNLEVAQTLLYEFANKYNLSFDTTSVENMSIKQVYNAPYILTSFNEVFEGFRTLMYVSGVFLFTRGANYLNLYYSSKSLEKDDEIESVEAKYIITEEDEEILDSDREIPIEIDLKFFKEKTKTKENKQYIFTYNELFKSWYNEEDIIENNILEYGISLINRVPKNGDKIIINYTSGWEYIEALSTSLVCDINLDSQAFYDSNGFTTSRAKFASRTFSLTSYLLDNDFFNKCIDVMLEQLETENKGIDTPFRMLLEFSSLKRKLAKDFRMANFSLNQPLKEIPVVSLTFTN